MRLTFVPELELDEWQYFYIYEMLTKYSFSILYCVGNTFN